MDDKVHINSKVFRALSSDRRIEILERLSSRKMSLTDLSRVLNLPKSTIKYHLTILIDAGLVESKRYGRWAYYELTSKGKVFGKHS